MNAPITSVMKPVVRIEDWFLSYPNLCGRIDNHPHRGSIPNARTSRIVHMDLASRRVETENTIYDLGEVQAGYREWLLKTPRSRHVAAQLVAGGFFPADTPWVYED